MFSSDIPEQWRICHQKTTPDSRIDKNLVLVHGKAKGSKMWSGSKETFSHKFP